MKALTKNIRRELVASSSLPRLNLDDIKFGSAFTDHMLVMKHIDGEWQEPSIKPYGDFLISPSSSVFHYGQAIFEGMKAYKDSNSGDALLFRPQENAKRFNRSAKRMGMPEIPESLFLYCLTELINLERDWIPDLEDYSLYIRPYMYADAQFIGVRPSNRFIFSIICSPVGPYYKRAVDVLIETDYVRAVNGGTGFAKCAGNYAATFYPAMLAKERGYDQILWLDAYEHKYAEEIGTMNVCFVIDGEIVTPPVSNTILEGITRDSLLKIARAKGIKVNERRISVDEITTSIENGSLTEAFGVGTAAVISPIASFGYKDKDYALPKLKPDAMAYQLKQELNDIRIGKVEDNYNWVMRL